MTNLLDGIELRLPDPKQPDLAALEALARNLINPEVYGFAVNAEIRNSARRALGMTEREPHKPVFDRRKISSLDRLNTSAADRVRTAQPVNEASMLTAASRKAVLDDLKYRIGLGPNDADAVGPYDYLDELNEVAKLHKTDWSAA